MFRKISSRVARITIVTLTLISLAISTPVPVNSSASRQSEDPHESGRVNLSEGALATLSKLADIRLSNLAAYQQQRQRRIFNRNDANESATKFRENTDNSKFGDNEEFERRTFHCHPIEDVFIPAVDRKVPAYICKLDLRQFILSSERFLQDFKYHLDVTIDERTFRRLISPDETAVNENLHGNVIPVTLTQRLGDEFYGVKTTRI